MWVVFIQTGFRWALFESFLFFNLKIRSRFQGSDTNFFVLNNSGVSLNHLLIIIGHYFEIVVSKHWLLKTFKKLLKAMRNVSLYTLRGIVKMKEILLNRSLFHSTGFWIFVMKASFAWTNIVKEFFSQILYISNSRE